MILATRRPVIVNTPNGPPASRNFFLFYADSFMLAERLEMLPPLNSKYPSPAHLRTTSKSTRPIIVIPKSASPKPPPIQAIDSSAERFRPSLYESGRTIQNLLSFIV